MESINKKKYFFVLSKLLTALFILAGFFVWISIVKAETDHVVISEIQTGTTENGAEDEFIELYNPTDREINLTGWELRKKNSSGNEENLVDNADFVGSIAPKSFFLVAHKNYKGQKTADLSYSTSANLAYINNSMILYNGDYRTGLIIDEVFYSSIIKGQSLERKAQINNICVSAQGDGELLGNSCDVGDLDDFETRIVPNPQNASSSAEPAIENTPMPDPNPTPPPETGASLSANTYITPQSIPAAEAGSDKETIVGESVDFDGSDSFDPQGKNLSYDWSFGDGESGKGENARHIYILPGEYTVVLKTTNGVASSEDSLKVKVSEPEFSDKIILSEILPDPKGLDKEGEWIELSNIGDKKINLRGWILDDRTDGGGKPYTFKDDVFIEPQGFLVIKRQESKLVLPNKGGELNLLWYDKKSLSKVSYGAAKEGQSYALINGAWQWTADMTPEEKNVLSQSVSKTASKTSIVKITASDGKQDIDSKMGGASIKSEEVVIRDESDNSISAFVEEQIDKSVDSQEKISLPGEKENNTLENNKLEINSKSLTAGELGGISGFENSEKLPQENNNETKNNPWFWGDMALSALSLFLVWRYQELKKRIK